MRKLTKRPLSIPDILRWADRHRETTGRWPTKDSSGILGVLFATWPTVDAALRRGTRGLPGGSSLAQLLAERRGVRNIRSVPSLTEEMILAWCDAHFKATGQWPSVKSGKVAGTDEKWANLNQALLRGLRNLPGGSSLARLLAQHRGVRNRKALSTLTEEQILAWCDAHHTRTDSWPMSSSGPINDAPGETWMAVEMALNKGRRGLPGGKSLAWLLAEKRGVAAYYGKPPLTEALILDWVDNHHLRTGTWPTSEGGPVPGSPGDTWVGVDQALKQGHRTLPGRSSLAKLLAAARGVRNPAGIPSLTKKQILVWADAHHRRTGTWPTSKDGDIPEAPGETWSGVNAALAKNSRGLRGQTTLAQFLACHRGKRLHRGGPNLTIRQILEWADAFHARAGRWPRTPDGAIPEAQGETWRNVDQALRVGSRGQPGGSSLARLLARKRGARNPAKPPALTVEQVLRWSKAHRERTGRWPSGASGPVAEAPGESWSAIDMALRHGRRGLPGGISLGQLLEKEQHLGNARAQVSYTETHSYCHPGRS